MADPDPWSLPPTGTARPQPSLPPTALPWWPVALGCVLIALPFAVLFAFIEKRVPVDHESAIMIVGMLTGFALPATLPATIVYAFAASVATVRRMLHLRRLRDRGERI